MPRGKGTYGSKRGRPPKKKKAKAKARVVTKSRRGKKPGQRRKLRGKYTG